jgi:ankyrin repeat protein
VGYNMPIMNTRELSDVCCARNADPGKQRAIIEALLSAGADIQETDKNGVTPLHHAVRFRSPTAVETLLRHGASVNQTCKRSGSTALHRAVTFTGAPSTAGKAAEARQIIEILLRYGADPSIKNKSGKRAADYVRDEELRHLLSNRPTTPARRPRKARRTSISPS